MTTYQGTILDEGGAVFNVSAYTSPHAALGAAISAGRGVVYFPPGIYPINSPLIIEGEADISLVGAGPNATQLLQGSDQGVIVIRDSVTSSSARIQIQGFWIGISEGPVHAGGVGISISSSTPHGASVISVKDIELMNVPYPFAAENVHQSVFENIRVTANLENAVKGTLFNQGMQEPSVEEPNQCHADLPRGELSRIRSAHQRRL